MFNEEDILVEIQGLYDGWIAKYNSKTKEVVLRDFYITAKWGENKRNEVINLIKKSFDGN